MSTAAKRRERADTGQEHEEPRHQHQHSGGRIRRRPGYASSLLARGEPMVWFTGGGLAICLLMILGLLAFITYQGFSTFWPVPIVRINTVDGQSIMGEVTRSETYSPADAVFEAYPPDVADQLRARVASEGGQARRRLVRTGNYELTNEHFRWVSDFEIAEGGETMPEWALVFERRAWGRFYGTPIAFSIGDDIVAEEPPAVWRLYNEHRPEVQERWERRRELEKDVIGDINHQLETGRLHLRELELEHGKRSDIYQRAQDEFAVMEQRLQERFAEVQQQIEALNEQNARYKIVVHTAQGQEQPIELDQIVRAYPANQLGFAQTLGVYGSRWWEFLSDEPREANSEGGVFPAIFGTVVMTLLMSVAVVPFGVLAALYLREYAKAGAAVSAVRIAINNLAGVPSIVFGVFGLGFFSYIIGARIDELLFAEKLPSPTYGTGGILWAALTLALLTLPVVIVATEEALAAVPNSMREGSYACGASKWQTIRRIVLPRAMPGVMTGLILAMARGAGEVAPLMLVGAVKLAPELPIDGYFPYVHLERSFMHLGFHIYDLGFQSQNSEASKPMVFTTTLLLIVLIFFLNLVGVYLRGRLRRRFSVSAF